MGDRRKTRGQEAPPKVLSPPFPLSQPCRHGQMVSGIDTFAGCPCPGNAMPLPDQQVATSYPAPLGGVSDKGVDLWPYGERTAR